MGAVFGGFTFSENLAVNIFAGSASATNGGSSSIQQGKSQTGSAAQSKQSSSQSNNTASTYINLGISSFAQGFTEGTEIPGLMCLRIHGSLPHRQHQAPRRKCWEYLMKPPPRHREITSSSKEMGKSFNIIMQ